MSTVVAVFWFSGAGEADGEHPLLRTAASVPLGSREGVNTSPDAQHLLTTLGLNR